MQSNPHPIEALREQRRQRLVFWVERVCVDTTTLQAREHGIPTAQRDLPLSGGTTEQHGYMAEFLRIGGLAHRADIVFETHQAGAPRIRTSVCRRTPC